MFVCFFFQDSLMLSFLFLLIWVETAVSHPIAFCDMSGIVLIWFLSFHSGRQQKSSPCLFPFTLNGPLLKNLGNMNFKLKYVKHFRCNAERQNSLVLKYSPCFFLSNVVLKIRQASFAEPEIGLTALFVARHTTGKPVVVGWSDKAPRERYPTWLAFHVSKESKFWC